MTDAMLTWQTERLLELAVHRDAYTVYVRPELVVEIAFDGVQTSPRYPAGMALRFARVLRYRDDKKPADVDTVQMVREIHVGGAEESVAEESVANESGADKSGASGSGANESVPDESGER
jgi:DNA ligase-1